MAYTLMLDGESDTLAPTAVTYAAMPPFRAIDYYVTPSYVAIRYATLRLRLFSALMLAALCRCFT